MVALNLLLTTIIISIVSSTISDIVHTFQDIKVIVPEVRRALNILTSICKTDEFERFCGTV